MPYPYCKFVVFSAGCCHYCLPLLKLSCHYQKPQSLLQGLSKGKKEEKNINDPNGYRRPSNHLQVLPEGPQMWRVCFKKLKGEVQKRLTWSWMKGCNLAHWIHGLALNPKMVQARWWWTTPWTCTLFYEGAISSGLTQQVVWPMGHSVSLWLARGLLVQGNTFFHSWLRLEGTVGGHLLQREPDECLKWHDPCSLKWIRSISFLVFKFQCFCMKDFNFLKAKTAIASLPLFLYAS